MNELVLLDKFQSILESPAHPYRPSAETIAVLQNTKVALFVGPSGAGRNTIISQLLKKGGYHFIVSDTTRAPRVNNGVLEQNGVEYWFRSEADVLQELRRGEFLEAAVIHQTQVSGVSVREIAKAHDQNEVAVTDIEIQGVKIIRSVKPDVECIFVVPPRFDAWQQRLKNRGDMHTEAYKRRMESAVKEFQAALDNPYYWIVVNDDLDKTVAYANQVITEGKPDPQHQAEGREVIERLLEQTTHVLNNL